MSYRFLYIFFILIASASIYAQDTLVKNDSSRISAKILEIRPAEIKFKYFNYQEGPLLVLPKKDVAYIIYSNGKKEIFNDIPITKIDSFYYEKQFVWQGDTSRSKKRTEPKIGDYINFNIELGAIINKSYCNVPKPPVTSSRYESKSEDFSKLNNKTYFGYYLGANLLLGKGNICKHILGVSYLNSTSQYIYHHYSTEYGSTYYTPTRTEYVEAEYKSTTHYVNLTNGIRFIIGKKINLENHLTLNIPFAAKNDVRGTITNSTYKNVPNPSGTSFNTVLDTKEVLPLKETNTRIMTGFTISFMPKISYQLTIKQQKFELSYAYNMAIFKYILPWHSIGIAYYPFKALKSIPEKSKTKSKLIKKPQLNIEAGALFNNGFTHTEEDYSGVKTLNATQYKTGYSFGLNFLHGGSTYFKHTTTVSFSESYAELHQRHYYYAEDKLAGYKYEYIYSTIYNSTLRFLNIGTGLRFIVFEHLNFDNGIAFNTPIYSHNQIIATKETNQSTYNGNSTSSTVEILENKSSSDFLIRKENWSLFAKITYELNIKETRLGVFASWNYKIRNSAQWFVAGITYYPFKKFR